MLDPLVIMPHRLFVVSGCKRSGLGRTARVLTALGAPCGYEEVFSPASFRSGPTLVWPARFAGDASWYAAPVLSKLPEASVVLHQIREPLESMTAIHSSGLFESQTEQRRFVEDFVPEARTGGPLVRTMRYWLHWNQIVENASDYDDIVYRRVRAEDLDAQTIVETAALLGISRSRASAQMILETIEDEEPLGQLLTWDDLPKGQLRDRTMALAERYGYAA